ncbi:MAG: FemAB family PEP-CTERM system-associated protein [Planctomycetia bacterium]|nr:FemAB family PEP-CTERM system-associated protein [Planctomycetia bacterium]
MVANFASSQAEGLSASSCCGKNVAGPIVAGPIVAGPVIQPGPSTVQVHLRRELEHLVTTQSRQCDGGQLPVERAIRWLLAVCEGLKHEPYLLEAWQDDRLVGVLPLALVRSVLFGRFLVSLPYVNSAGPLSPSPVVASLLIDRAVHLADELDVRHLELRHEVEHSHPALTNCLCDKVHMRLALPDSADALWKKLGPKVRNQVRKGQNQGLSVHWGKRELLEDFYAVFSRNMRDLGTPVYGRRLFESILHWFPDSAELCVVRLKRRPIATALLVHTLGVSEVPSASSLRPFNSTNANMLMYWQLLCRAIERRQSTFDFGRSTIDSNTYRFKAQWSARPVAAIWQYYVRRGDPRAMRPESPKYRFASRVWRHLPLRLTRLLGPRIVRGIP